MNLPAPLNRSQTKRKSERVPNVIPRMRNTSLLLSTFLVFFCGSARDAAAQAPQRNMEEMFKRLDRNGDGKLSREEIPQRFDGLDKNKDGFVTRDELGLPTMAPTNPVPPTTADKPTAKQSVDIVKKIDVRNATMPGVEAKLHSLGVYSPKDVKGAPVIVFVHGAGWRGGGKSNGGHGEKPAQLYYAEGFVFVSMNYRLTPAGQHPANIQDVAKAVAWVHDHIAESGGDPPRERDGREHGRRRHVDAGAVETGALCVGAMLRPAQDRAEHE